LHDIVYLPLGAAAFGGAERSLLELAEAMRGCGKRVAIFAEDALRRTAFADSAAKAGIDVHWMRWAPEHGALHNFAAAFSAFRRFPARVIHFNMSWRRNMWAVPLAARVATSAQLVGSMRAMPDPHNLVPRRRYLGFIPGLQLWHVPERIAGKVWSMLLDVTVSINAIDFPTRLARDFGFDRRRIKVIPNGIRVRREVADADARARRRSALGVQPDEVAVCYAGRLSAEKGVDDLLRAMAQLPARYKAVIAGDGPEEASLQALAQELGIAGRTFFIGFTADVEGAMAACDIIAVPSTCYEAFGRSVVEAMNEGVPVVASRIGGMAEVFTDGVEGLYFEPRSVVQLAERLRSLGDTAALRLTMGNAARRRVAADYSIERVIQQHGELYAELLREPAPSVASGGAGTA
jgi:glycosyltransferase involved in cell wall biosynthesis